MNARQAARLGLKLVRYYVDVMSLEDDERRAGGWGPEDVGVWGVDVVFGDKMQVIGHVECYGERGRYYCVSARSRADGRKALGMSGLSSGGYKLQREAVAALLRRYAR